MNFFWNADKPMNDRDFRALLRKADRLTEESRNWTAAERSARNREISEMTAKIVKEMEKRNFAGQ